MTEEKSRKDSSEIKFNIKQLAGITFGKLEGERDPLLKDCFFPTYTIQKYLHSPYNYVLSPKGAGKSALFRSLTDNFIPNSLFKNSKYSIIAINEAFGFEDDYLSKNKFQEDSRMKLTISWALFILTKLITDIKENHSNAIGYQSLIGEITKITELKDKFNLYDLSDLLKSISTSIKFTANGQEFEAAPTLKINPKKQKLVLNTLFKKISEFYSENNIEALILIDRIDNFVQKEEYQLQRKYIQGLFDCIEELSLLDSITPTMFLRTDLFYSYESDIEYDKVKDRTIELKWDKGETLNFIVYRLNHNQYISENYSVILSGLLDEAHKGKHREFKTEKLSLWKRCLASIFNNKKAKTFLDTNRPLNYTVSDKFLKVFFPEKIECFDSMDFSDWIFEYLKDANSFVNPRLLIYFFNQLMEKQCEINRKFYPDKPSDIESFSDNGYAKYDLFSDDAFTLTYEKVQQDELKNIYTILKKKIYQDLFRIINNKTYETGVFRYGDVNIKKLNVDKEQYESLLKYLKLLGYCKETEKQKFEIPKIYLAQFALI
ncbi:MAG: hypothetical protein ACI93N_002204 [Flavobacteriaceae bacterium]|jgi:hypothetical protein